MTPHGVDDLANGIDHQLRLLDVAGHWPSLTVPLSAFGQLLAAHEVCFGSMLLKNVFRGANEQH